MSITIHPICGVPMLEPNDDLPGALFAAMEPNGLQPLDGDILVVCQKVVSKVEGRVVDLCGVTPSAFARHVATASEHRDPRIVEVVLRETKRIVKMDRGHLIVETGPGWVCANAGIDQSNSGDPERVVLLPVDPDASARRIAEAAHERYGCRIAVIITDTFGRPWREGLVEFALGVTGIAALLDLRGSRDLGGRELRHTIIAQADALAAAAGLVMQKAAAVPAAIIRGYRFEPADGRGTELIRDADKNLFR